MHLFRVGLLLSVTSAVAWGQTPQPFPRPGEAQPPRSAAPATQVPGAPQPRSEPVAQSAADPGAPPAAEVWFPVYPAAQFLVSYEAGRGQRYYIFGTTAPFEDIVSYYRMQLDERGSLVFKEPATHMFEVGRFRDETMAFPPGVTVKDWTWGGSQGYVNPRTSGKPERFPTVIMIVPPPPGTERQR